MGRPISMPSPDRWRAATSSTNPLPFSWTPVDVDFKGPRVWPGESMTGFGLLMATRCKWCLGADFSVDFEEASESQGDVEPWRSKAP
jgi:hypothetical protein